jgi:acyl-CoA synthetase (AMP-forming)/AMP-acid ligase II
MNIQNIYIRFGIFNLHQNKQKRSRKVRKKTAEVVTTRSNTSMPYFPEIKTIGDITRYHAKQRGDQIAFVFENRSQTYAELDAHTSQVANALVAEGLKAQTRIAVMDKNSDWFFELVLGSAKADMVLVGINWRLAPPEVAFVINNAEAELLFVGPEFLALAEQIKSELGTVKKIILMADKSADLTCYPVWRNAASEADPAINISDKNVAIQMYTSGTTGHPKGVMLSHANLLASYKASGTSTAPEEEWSQWTNKDVSLVAMPNFHIGGTGWAFMGLYAGAKNVILKEFVPSEVLRCFREYGISKIFMVPAAMQFVLLDPTCKDTDFSSMKYIIYGASPIPLDLLRRAMETFKCGFVQLYGMTEGTAIGSYLPAEDHDPAGNRRMKSAGKARPGVQITIQDAEGKILPVGEVGEICIKSDSIMVGYWKKEQATRETIVDGWLKSGDAGYMDEDAYVYVHDRIKDMIVSGGENIYPAEIESALFGHPALADIAVIGVPDDKWGEAVKAVVVLKPECSVSEAELIAFARQKIAGFKIPKSVDFVSVLPRNPSGKLLKRELREPYWQGKERRVN